jgi:hypothetical protein
MNVQLIDTRRPRTPYVDWLAWIAVAGAAVGALICLPRAAWFDLLAARAGAGEALSGPALQFVLGLWPAIAAGLLLLFALGLVAGLGLLRRRNWARVLLVVLLALGATASVALLLAQLLLDWRLPLLPVPAPAGLEAAAALNLAWMLAMLRAVLDAGALGFALVCGWFIRYLNSRPVRAEFSPGRGPA